MWKKAVTAGVSLFALHGVAQAPVQWKYVNQTLDEIARDSMSSSPLLRKLSVVFDEARTDLSQNRLTTRILVDVDGLKVQGSRVGAEVQLALKADSQVIANQRAVKGAVLARVEGDVMGNLKQGAKEDQGRCQALSSRAESYAKFLDSAYCKVLPQVQAAKSPSDIAKILKDLQKDLIARYPSYIQTVKGEDQSDAQRDLDVLKSLKIEQNGTDLQMSIHGNLKIAANSESQTSLTITMTASEIGMVLGFEAKIDEARFQKEKAELTKWVVKIENKDGDLLNATRLKIYEVMKSLEQSNK